MKARILAIGLTVTCLLSGRVSEGANRIVVEHEYVFACGPGTVAIYIENDVDLSRLSLPLVARALGFGDQFWADSVRMIGPMGRLSNSLTGTRFFDKSRTDFTSPDQFVLFFESSAPGTDCLPSGPLEPMLSLKFGTVPVADFGFGFEIDTMASIPCFEVQMLRCGDQAPLVIDQFVKGNVEFLIDGFIFVEMESDSVVGMAGASLHNQLIVDDPEGDPVGFELLSGPGVINPASGRWTWGTRRQDAGQYTVDIDVYQESCGPGTFMSFSFPVTVTPHPEGDVNCDGQSDALDLAAIIDHLFAGIPLVPCPE